MEKNTVECLFQPPTTGKVYRTQLQLKNLQFYIVIEHWLKSLR